MGQAWRMPSQEFKWDENYSNVLEKNVSAISTKSHVRPTLLLFGPTGHGKSTIINSISTISQKRGSNVTNSGAGVAHCTSVFRRYKLQGSLDNFHLADTKGIVDIEADNGFLVENVVKIIQGHIRPETEFNLSEFTTEGSFYNASPQEHDKVHCVICVFDITKVTKPEVALTHFRPFVLRLLDHLNKIDVPRIVILTHADKIDEKVDKGISYIFHSEKVKKAVECASELFGIPLENIHPIKNYGNTKTGYTDPLLHIPILLALQQALYYASDTLAKRQS